MVYAKSDLGYMSSPSVPTNDLTIPEGDENQFYTDNTAAGESNSKVTTNKNMVFGSVALLVAVMFILHFLGGE